MSTVDSGSSVTLILYSIDRDWWKGREPFLNLLAAAAQLSSFTHVELAIGEGSGAHGEMVNVLRVFNDSTGVVSYAHSLPLAALSLKSSPTPHRLHFILYLTGACVDPLCIAQELTNRTGKNPNYQYLQIGCSQKSTQAMLNWAARQVGKPFSSTGMARSILWPRETTGDSFYCAELVAACLQQGGLMNPDSKPGAATPYSLYKMYKSQGAIMANPCTLRQQFGLPASRPHTAATAPLLANAHHAARAMQFDMQSLVSQSRSSSSSGSRRRSDSPPRMQFKVIQARGVDPRSSGPVTLSLSSLSMNRTH
jgi:hypothetical protein